MLRHTLVTSLCAAALLAACGTGAMAPPATIAPTVATPSPPPMTPSPPATAASPPTSTSTSPMPASTTSPSSTEMAPPVTLSLDGPWTRVDSAPGVTTAGLVYELMPKLWAYLPTEIDLEHGITWTFNENDRPVIEAYLRGQRAYYWGITRNPMDLEAQQWNDAFEDGVDTFGSVLAERRAAGQHAELGAGVVLRPQVLGEGRDDDSAIVFDCMLDGGLFLAADGSPAPGSSWAVSPYGLGMRLAAHDGRWTVVQVGRQPDAC